MGRSNIPRVSSKITSIDGNGKPDTVEEFGLLAETAAHELNHMPRRCLKGRTACRVYFGNDRMRYPKRQREVDLQLDHDLAAEISIRGRKEEDHTGGVEGGSKTMVGEKWIDQNPDGRKSVTQFFFKFVP